MAVLAGRWRSGQAKVVETAAAWAGAAVRRVGVSVPGVGGPLLVAAGLWMAWHPLGLIFAGGVLWALDRRVP